MIVKVAASKFLCNVVYCSVLLAACGDTCYLGLVTLPSDKN